MDRCGPLGVCPCCGGSGKQRGPQLCPDSLQGSHVTRCGFYILQWKFHSRRPALPPACPAWTMCWPPCGVSSHKCKVMYYRGDRLRGTGAGGWVPGGQLVMSHEGVRDLGGERGGRVSRKAVGGHHGPSRLPPRAACRGSMTSLESSHTRVHAQCRHHLVQPVPLQLHDLQVVPRSARRDPPPGTAARPPGAATLCELLWPSR